LFTFPLLNGIAVIAGAQPVVVADAIYPLVIFNCVLFALLVSFPQNLPPASTLPRQTGLAVRIFAWIVTWLLGAYLITDFRAAIPGAAVLFVGASAFAILFMFFFWARSTSVADTPPPERARHIAGFTAFWANPAGAGRIVFFALAYTCLFWASRAALDEKWIGMASALPLPGFFALAVLMDADEPGRLLAMRDTLFLGPVLVIPFNWTFSHLLLSVPPDAIAARYALLFVCWVIAALAVVLAVPRLAAYFDRRS
jgi:hypothetical protein